MYKQKYFTREIHCLHKDFFNMDLFYNIRINNRHNIYDKPGGVFST